MLSTEQNKIDTATQCVEHGLHIPGGFVGFGDALSVYTGSDAV